MKCSLRIPITEMSQVGEARRIAAQYSREIIQGEVQQGKIALIITELATNLIKHANGGELVLTSYPNAIDITSIDKGPGIRNISESIQDGFSTSGTPGNGLGAVQRLADVFDVFSIPGQGTILLARVGKVKSENDLGSISVPVSGETECGDGWAWKEFSSSMQAMVVDGLGHGPLAAKAAQTAIESFERNASSRDHSTLFQAIHGGLRATRGSAASILNADFSTNIATFTGIGNVSGLMVFPSGMRRMISHNGIVGQNMRKVQDFIYPIENPNTIFILHSDGIHTHWDLAFYPGLLPRHPSVIAAILFRDHCRGRDDASVFVFRKGLPA